MVVICPGCHKTVTGAGRKEAKAVRVNGAEFRPFAEGQIRAPALGEERPIDLGLRITNASKKPLVFYNVVPAFSSLRRSPAMIVLPAPGSSARRKRMRGRRGDGLSFLTLS